MKFLILRLFEAAAQGEFNDDEVKELVEAVEVLYDHFGGV